MIGKLKLVFWVGIVLIFLPHIGLPDTWKGIFTVLIGVFLIILSVRLKHGYKKMKFQMRHLETEEPTQVHE